MGPGMLGKRGEPRYLVQILDAIPTRKMIQVTEGPALDPGAFIGEIVGDALPKAPHHLYQTHIPEIANHISTRHAPSVTGELTTQREIASVIEVILFLL